MTAKELAEATNVTEGECIKLQRNSADCLLLRKLSHEKANEGDHLNT